MKTTLKLSLTPILLTLIFLVSGVHQTQAQVVTTSSSTVIGTMTLDPVEQDVGESYWSPETHNKFEGTTVPIVAWYGYASFGNGRYDQQDGTNPLGWARGNWITNDAGLDDNGSYYEDDTVTYGSNYSCFYKYSRVSPENIIYIDSDCGFDSPLFGIKSITLNSKNNIDVACDNLLTGPGTWNADDPQFKDCTLDTSTLERPDMNKGTISDGNVFPYLSVIQVVTPPLNLIATSTGSLGNYGTKLDWTPSTSTDQTAQFIERATSSNPFEIIGTLGVKTTTYQDQPIGNEITDVPYNYQIAAHYPDLQADGSTIDDLFDHDNFNNDANSNIATSSPDCLHISGKGAYSIVFVIGKHLLNYDKKINPIDDIGYVNNIIDNGFKSIDPFKKYIDKFSFYFDNKSIDENRYTKSGTFFDDSVANLVASDSKCKLSGQTEYVYLFGDPNLYYAWTVHHSSTVFINVSKWADALQNMSNKFSGETLDTDLVSATIHESGHHIGELDDEYANGGSAHITGIYGGTYDYSTAASSYGLSISNCSSNPRKQYSYNGWIYGGTDMVGCHYLASVFWSYNRTYYRPSYNSIMNNGYVENRFNVISCGYVVAGILGEPAYRYYAETHWPECENMDTIKDGYMKMTQSPNINDIQIDKNTTGDNTYIVNGSGFSSAGNSISLTPSGSASGGPSGLAPSNTNLLASIGGVYKAVTGIVQSVINIILPSNSAPVGSDYQSADTANPTPTLDTTTVSSTSTDGGHYEIDDIPSDNSDGTSITFTVPNTVPDGVYTVSAASEASDWTQTPFTITVTGNGSGDPTTEIGPDMSDATTTTPPTSPVTPPTTASTTYTLIETTPVNKVLYTGTDKTFQLTGLSPNSSYCAILVATYPSGTTATSSEVCVNTQSKK